MISIMNTILACFLLPSLPALLQDDAAGAAGTAAADVKEALARFSHEPSCQEVVKQALEFSQKEKKVKLPSTKAVRASALLPLVRFSITKNVEYDESFALVEDDESTLKIYTDDDLKFKITLQWDLASLVFNSSESQVIARAQAEAKWRMELIKTVTDLYHQRRKLQVLLCLLEEDIPPETAVDWILQVEALSALLDALTGNWFSQEIEKAQKE